MSVGRFRVLLLCCTVALAACAEPTTEGVGHPAVADPSAVDAEYPPAMHQLSFESGGSKLNGLAYTANGPGPHPVVVLFHGYAGNERNLDLAQAFRRAGINVFYFNYRGSWGSGGEFSIANSIQDAAAALEFVRSPGAVSEYANDPNRVGLVGHSFGGFIATITASERDVDCLAYLAGADFGAFAQLAEGNPEVQNAFTAALGADMDEDGGPIRGDAEAMVSEIIDQASTYSLTARAPSLRELPVLLVGGSRDVTASMDQHHHPLAEALRAAGAEGMVELVFDDDHYFSAHRVRLAMELSDWLWSSCWN